MQHDFARWRRRQIVTASLIVGAALAVPTVADTPSHDAFSYQGRLTVAGSPVKGAVDLEFRLFDDPEEGEQVGPALGAAGFDGFDEHGRFTIDLEFGKGIFDGTPLWLETVVDGTPLTPRQPITPAPYSIRALDVALVQDTALTGTYTNALNLSNPANQFSGSGSGLTGLNASNISSGSLSIAHVPTGGNWSLSSTLVFGNNNFMVDPQTGRSGVATSEPRQQFSVGEFLDIYSGGVNGPTRPSIRASSSDNLILSSHGGGATFINFDSGTGGLRVYGGSSTTERLRVMPSGRVGIGTSNPAALMHVSGTGEYFGNHVALFENTQNTATADGVAIRINRNTTTAGNNFVTFLNGQNQVVGRIEGFSLASGDWVDPPPLQNPNLSFSSGVSLIPVSSWFNPGSLPSLSINFSSFSFNFNPGSLPSVSQPVQLSAPQISFTTPTLAQFQALACWAYQNDLADFLTTDPVALAMSAIKIAAAQVCRDGGVVYGTKGADYAEWMPKADPSETFRFGEIVGVHDGKVSRRTEGASHLFVVSRAPAVVGNMPDDDELDAHVMVGFVGQVDTLVRGTARSGDFIVASGFEDGTGYAVAPEDLRVEHLGRIVGRAWSDSTNPIASFVNVAIGVSTNEWSGILVDQQTRLDESATAIETLEITFDEQGDRIAELQRELQRVAANVDAIAATVAR